MTRLKICVAVLLFATGCSNPAEQSQQAGETTTLDPTGPKHIVAPPPEPSPPAEAIELATPAAKSVRTGEVLSQPEKITAKDVGLYKHILMSLEEPPSERIYYITLSPMSAWGEGGDWKPLPAELSDHISDSYRSAANARFKNGSVHPDNSDEQAWMQWITILSWDDEDTAVVEEGVWCCPLGGGASESTYRKVDGEWKQIDYGGGWVS